MARSKTLRGDWEQYAGNPILEGGDLWKCSGHGTIVQSPEGRYFYLYHAYHTYDFEFIGRQGLLDELLWDDEAGWPYFKYGRNPSLQAEVPFANTVQKRETQFYDNFATPEKDKYWLWDMTLPRPVLTKNNGKLTFASEGIGFCFRGVNVQTGNYTMETAVRNEGCHLKGICVYGNSTNLFTIGVEEGKVKLYQIEKGNQTELFPGPWMLRKYICGLNPLMPVSSVSPGQPISRRGMLSRMVRQHWMGFPFPNGEKESGPVY